LILITRYCFKFPSEAFLKIQDGLKTVFSSLLRRSFLRCCRFDEMRLSNERHVRFMMGFLLAALCVMPVVASETELGDHSQQIRVTMSSPEEIQEVSSLKSSANEPLTSVSETFTGALTGGMTISPAVLGFQSSMGVIPSTQFKPDNAETSVAQPLSPLVTQGIFPYQTNPIAAVIAAGVTLAAMSIKETGSVDVDSILFLLNSTDFYAGLVGTVSGSMGQRGGKSLVSMIGRGLDKLAPSMMEPLKQKEALKVVGNIVNGFTYSFSVSAGYETFSQFWKIATRNIPEAHKMTDFLSSPMHVKKRVALNLLYYSVLDKNLQKRVLDSVWNHRIMTFEFIAMNVGLYVGAQLGNYIAMTKFPKNVWAKRIAPVAGSIGLGVLIQMMPDSWKEYFNAGLLDWKIARQTARLKEIEQTIARGISHLDYPPESVGGLASYVASGVDLNDDIERLIGVRDLLVSLQMQKWMAHPETANLASDMQGNYTNVLGVVDESLDQVTQPQISFAAQIDQWVKENKSPEDIQRLSARFFQADPKRTYYSMVLDATRERVQKDFDDFLAFQRAFMVPESH
jgi:hypothetical protein